MNFLNTTLLLRSFGPLSQVAMIAASYSAQMKTLLIIGTHHKK